MKLIAYFLFETKFITKKFKHYLKNMNILQKAK
jgi:hypothetical protein